MTSSPTIERDAVSILEVIRRGGVALAQTQTGYGLVAMRSEGVRRIYDLKGRPSEKPCVTVGTMQILDQVATGIDPETRAWLATATASWPLAVIARLRRESPLLASFEPFVVFGLTALLYFCVCFPLTRFSRRLERRLAAARAAAYLNLQPTEPVTPPLATAAAR